MRDPNARALEDLLPLVASWIGFHPDAIRPGALERVARTLGVADAHELLARARDRDPAAVSALAEGVTVGETYFFRQPEHFRHLAEMAAAGRVGSRRRTLRAWSAGCATGEEAYSLTATLVGVAGLADVEVIGTDLLERNVRAAERGVYGLWSFRGHCPMLHPVTDAAEPNPPRGGTVEVSGWLRRHTTFQVANVLHPQPAFAERFDVILCRNVLVYFSAESARAALSNVAEALAPGGLLYLGPMDASALPPGLVPTGPVGLNVYTRATAGTVAAARPRQSPSPRARPAVPTARSRSQPRSAHGPPPAAASPPPPPEPIALHLRALAQLERGDLVAAGALLDSIRSCASAYLPGLLDLALVRDRMGKRAEASRLMREILDRTASLPCERTVPGPVDLSVGYLRASARAYLGNKGGRT